MRIIGTLYWNLFVKIQVFTTIEGEPFKMYMTDPPHPFPSSSPKDFSLDKRKVIGDYNINNNNSKLTVL